MRLQVTYTCVGIDILTLPDKYHTFWDLVHAPIPRIPDVHDIQLLKETKAITQSERYQARKGEKLCQIVYYPTMLDGIHDQAERTLSQISLRWNNKDDLMALAHLLPILSTPLLPQVVFSEEDTATWCDQTMFRPMLMATRMCTSHRDKGEPLSLGDLLPSLSDKLPPLHDLAGISSAPHFKIIPDRIFHTSITRNSSASLIPNTVATIEYKTQNVFTQELFSSVCDLPNDGTVTAHTLAFGWEGAEDRNTNLKLNKIIIQVGLGNPTVTTRG